jgi:hypothetical protein
LHYNYISLIFPETQNPRFSRFSVVPFFTLNPSARQRL